MIRLACLVMTAALAAAVPASAETYPARPIRIVVSTSAGGITDIAARILGNHLSTRTGQTVVIDNRSGAGGNIAMDAVAKSTPDGYTLGVANTGNIVINPYLYRQMPYDPLHDLAPVASLGEVPIFLVFNGKLPLNNLQDFVVYAKSHPVSYSSAGTGTTPHLAAELLKITAGINMTHVPYPGAGPAIQAILAGTVPLMCASLPGAHPGIKAGTPAEIVDRLAAASLAALKEPAFHDKLRTLGFEVIGHGPEGLRQRIAADVPRFR